MHFNQILFSIFGLLITFVISFGFVAGARKAWKRRSTLPYAARIAGEDLNVKWRVISRLWAERAFRRLGSAALDLLRSYWRFKNVDWVGQADLFAEACMLVALCSALIP
jgi:hypothetical protein